MGKLDAPLRAVAAKVISTFGTDVIFRLKTTGVFDEPTDSAAVTEVDLPAKAVVSDYTKSAFDGRVKSGDKQIIVAASVFGSAEPDEETEVFIAGAKHQVIVVRPIQATDESAAFEIAARGA